MNLHVYYHTPVLKGSDLDSSVQGAHMSLAQLNYALLHYVIQQINLFWRLEGTFKDQLPNI